MRRSSITGVRELERKLGRIARLASPAVAEPALLAGGEVIAEEMRVRVRVLSGLTRDSIAVEVASWSFGSMASGVSVRIGPTKPDGFKAHWIEWGTDDTPAHPFMRPAYDSKGRAAIDAVASRLGDELGSMTR